jgi:hypothetical protein
MEIKDVAVVRHVEHITVSYRLKDPLYAPKERQNRLHIHGGNKLRYMLPWDLPNGLKIVIGSRSIDQKSPLIW